jgi:hypothetical protein
VFKTYALVQKQQVMLCVDILSETYVLRVCLAQERILSCSHCAHCFEPELQRRMKTHDSRTRKNDTAVSSHAQTASE